MIEKLGPIPEKFLNSNKAFKDHYKNLMKEREGIPQKTLFDQFPNSSWEAVDLLSKMLQY